MNRKLSLDKTWEECLKMWKWISERWDGSVNVDDLKEDYAKIHSLSPRCLFCAVADGCDECPGRLVDWNFSCYNDDYCFYSRPKEFYQKLLELNAVRLSSRCLEFVGRK